MTHTINLIQGEKMKRSILLLLTVFSLLCQAQNEESNIKTENIAKAIESSNQWLKSVDSSNYELSWENSSELFKKSITKENWVSALESVRTPLGKITSREIKTKEYRTTLPGAPDGEYVVIVYITEFENKENSYETITSMKDKDGKCRVSGYYIK